MGAANSPKRSESSCTPDQRISSRQRPDGFLASPRRHHSGDTRRVCECCRLAVRSRCGPETRASDTACSWSDDSKVACRKHLTKSDAWVCWGYRWTGISQPSLRGSHQARPGWNSLLGSGQHQLARSGVCDWSVCSRNDSSQCVHRPATTTTWHVVGGSHDSFWSGSPSVTDYCPSISFHVSAVAGRALDTKFSEYTD